jgi:EAL domain-containing protein (putative c-di-GMP-specific phosphodiesterase class I)
VPQNTEDSAMMEAIITMGKALSLTVIAEGVETSEQLVFLADHNCDEMQGYSFSKPVLPEDFAELLRKNAYPEKNVKPQGFASMTTNPAARSRPADTMAD